MNLEAIGKPCRRWRLPATAVHVVDARTVTYDLSGGLPDGPHALQIAAGAVVDIQGTPIEAFSGSLTIDSNLYPRLVSSSIQQDDVVPTGGLIYTAQFGRPLDPTHLDPTDVELVGKNTGSHATGSLQYEPATSTLTVNFTLK